MTFHVQHLIKHVSDLDQIGPRRHDHVHILIRLALPESWQQKLYAPLACLQTMAEGSFKPEQVGQGIGGRKVRALLFLLASSVCGAAPLSEQEIATVYAAAITAANLGEPENFPVVHLLNMGELRKMVGCGDCLVRGSFINNEIYIDEALDLADPHQKSILLHEMVHYLQRAKLGEVKDCNEWLRRELEAFDIQMKELIRQGYSTTSEQDSRSLYTGRVCDP